MKKQFPIISFEHVSFQYEGQTRENLKDINLTIKSGEFLVITGQSGCGKTTLTRCNNLIPRFFEGTLSGEVIVSGRSIKESDAGEAGKEIASIFQDPRSQFFTTNSSSEVAFACENYGISHEEIVKRVDRAFQSLNMEDLKDRDIFTLSSGERQKIAFLAATALNPQIYVLDEPSANLDIHTILQVREILFALKAAGHTIVVSEHRLFYLYGLADRFLVMKEGQIFEELTGKEMAELSVSQMHNRRLRPLNLSTIQIERKKFICHSTVFFQIKDLSFSHKSMPELLHNISLEACKGETIALIGENGCGKTTLLRDMIRKISDEGQTVGVVDERSEIGACYQGVAQNDLGIQTDIMDACEKGQGMNMLIRSMAPDVIAVDEIGSKEDVEALFFCAYRGCSILATAHGKNKESLSKNPYMREIINKKMFQRYVILEQRNQPGYIAQIIDENGVVLN